LDYTLDLATILDAILPRSWEGSISTLPVAWGDPPLGEPELRQAAANLMQVARRLAELESETGRLMYLCLEPEPGCVLQRGSDVVRFFEEHLLRGGNAEQVLRYLRVCHDVCHTAVMFENQGEVLSQYAAAGIKVGKLQVSSAIRLDLDPLDPAERTAALSELALFAEDRYLHQTTIRTTAGGSPQCFEDLTDPLRQALGGARRSHGQWRVHFHVPIYLVQFGRLATTRDEIEHCLAAIHGHCELRHLEVETYAWNVLPLELREPELADGIARELQWLADLLDLHG
jgi:hypothetical protein